MTFIIDLLFIGIKRNVNEFGTHLCTLKCMIHRPVQVFFSFVLNYIMTNQSVSHFRYRDVIAKLKLDSPCCDSPYIPYMMSHISFI